ncbi:hypothetical protein [Micromonospora sp. NPDC050495]|uniref:hypothetical protein n=1 Tax=Micromonospora sp. NPDC050495 TaxID=3154936 RepID=UPI0033C2E2ED
MLSIVGTVFGLIIALYFIVRAVVEPFIIDFSDPASYQDDWGGPSLPGRVCLRQPWAGAAGGP